MTDRVSKLRIVKQGPAAAATDDALLTVIHNFIHENLLDMDGDPEADVVLEQPRSDERLLGKLTAFERRAFILAALLEQRLNDTMVELEAGGAEKIAAIMRERKVNFIQASQIYTQEIRMDDTQRADINMCAMTHSNVATLYDWSVRSRFNEWASFLIVREGFVVYSHG